MIKIVAGMALVVALSLGGCASGPSDFVKMSRDGGAASGPKLRTSTQQTALAASLAAQRRGGDATSGETDGSAASLMALTVIRQQQNEEAQALLAESGASTPINKPVCDPTATTPVAGCPVSPVGPQASVQTVQ